MTEMPPAPQYAVPPKKKSNLVRNLLIALIAFLVLCGGGCLATTALFANSVDEAIEEVERSTASEPRDEGSKADDKKAPEMTSGQENALRAAENYLDTMPMSKKGLIRQLSSPAGDGYSRADATFAANHVDADWKAEAAEAARNYIDIMPMSRDALIQQLEASAGDAYTHEQAVYGADQALK